MIYGLYLSAQGAEVQSMRQDVLSHNLANSSTTAFKRTLAIAQSAESHDKHHGIPNQAPGDVDEQSGGVYVAETVTDYSNGGFMLTKSSFDVALGGPGFMRVSDGSQEYLTRDGRLDFDRNGQIVQQGTRHRVAGLNGPLVIDPLGPPPQINSEGLITQGPETIGRIALVKPENTKQLTPVGEGLYKLEGKPISDQDETVVKQGYLENSGTNPTLEMLELIESSRLFESNINMIKMQDESLDRLISSLPRR